MADWAEVLVIDPELEVWVWSDSPHVASSLGWTERSGDLRAWLTEQGLWPTNEAKPPDPKAAVEAVVWHVQTPRSSSIYRKLATNVSLHRCTDASFNRLLGILRTWFPPDAGLSVAEKPDGIAGPDQRVS